jgi:O-antigen ligase
MGIVAFLYLIYFTFNLILTSEFAFILNLENQFIFPVVYLFFGEQAVLSIASGLILYDMAKSSEIKKIIIFFLICLFIANLFVFSRATLISALLIFALRFIFIKNNERIDLSFENIKKYFKKSIVVILIFISLYFSYFQVIKSVRFYRNSISSSSEARADFISEGIRVFKENPILGYGPGSNKTVTNSYLIQTRYGGASDAHSIFQSLLVETGVIGFILFMYIILSISRNLYKNMKNSESLYDNRIYFNLSVLLFVAFLMQIVSVNYYTDKLIFPLGLCIIYLEINKNYEKNISNSLYQK